MATRIARANKQERDAQQYIVLRDEVKHLEDRKKALNTKMKDYLQNSGVSVEGGHQEFRFSEPITVDGRVFLGMVNRRKNSPTINSDKVEEVLEKNEIPREKVFKLKTIEVLDQDELFALNQLDELPDEDLDAVFEDNISWALEVIEDK